MTKTKETKILLPIEAIQERDMDLLLLEEFYCSPVFRKWFVDNTVGSSMEIGEFVGVWHSLNAAELAENDLVLKFSGRNGGGFLFLIENKIHAIFQPKQALRYRSNGETCIQRGECEAFVTVLLAPQKYFGPDDGFHYNLAYEKIRDWFLEQSDLGERAAYKAELIRLAIERLRRGYRPVRDEKATAFWRQYWESASAMAIELNMKEPGDNIPRTSTFIFYRPAHLSKGLVLYHKAAHGFVELEFTGKGDRTEFLKKKFGLLLEPGMVIRKTSKSATVSLPVPKLNILDDFKTQKDAVGQAFDSAKRLYHWAMEHLPDGAVC